MRGDVKAVSNPGIAVSALRVKDPHLRQRQAGFLASVRQLKRGGAW
jgi:hypothetical protein